MNWAVGVTTVPQRRSTLLPRTRASLWAAGFEKVRVFWDGPGTFFESSPITARQEPVGALANWLLGLHELWLRNPRADLYLMVQDDAVFVRNLRGYLDSLYNLTGTVPGNCYWNLYCAGANEPKHATWVNRGHVDIAEVPSKFYPAESAGRGALALAFDNPGVQMLLRSPAWADAVLSGTDRATKRIDGTVSSAFRAARGRELVHWPSLCQHVGEESTLGNPPGPTHKAPSFPGEDFDALEWLK